MAGFYATYAGVAVVGALSVWFVVPALKPGAREAAPAANSVVAAPPRPAIVTRPSPPTMPTHPVVAAPPTLTAPVAAPEVHEGQPASPVATTAVTTPVATPETSAPPTAPATAAYDWGVLAEGTRSYSAAGQPNGRVPGGTVLERISVHESSEGRMVRCRLLLEQCWKDGYFIPEAAIVAFKGPYVDAPTHVRETVVRFFTLRAMVADRRTELRDRVNRNNPHYAAYQAAAKACADLAANAKQLVAQRDAATGTKRERLADDLRRLKYEEAALLRALHEAEAPYKKWRAENGGGESATPVPDERIAAWERELAGLEPQVRGMVDGNL